MHEDYGDVGARLKDTPQLDPLGGMTFAHDMLEHLSLDGSLADEAQAFGGVLYVRALSSWWHLSTTQLRTSYADNTGNEAAELLHQFFEEESYELDVMPKKVDLSDCEYGDDAKEDIKEAKRLIRKLLIVEHEVSRKDARSLTKWWCRHVRTGYRRVEEVYLSQGIQPPQARMAFDAIAGAVTRYLGDAEYEHEATLTFSWDTNECFIDEDYGDDWEEEE